MPFVIGTIGHSIRVATSAWADHDRSVPTPEATAKPTPKPTPEATPEPTPKPAPERTPTAEPTPKATPKALPTPLVYQWRHNGYPNATCTHESSSMQWIWTGDDPASLTINGQRQTGEWAHGGQRQPAWHFRTAID